MKEVKLSEVLKQLKEDFDPFQRFVQFYELLGWDKETQLDPRQIKLNKNDWIKLIDNEMQHAKKFNIPAVSVGFLWVDRGPSIDESVTEGIILIEGGVLCG